MNESREESHRDEEHRPFPVDDEEERRKAMYPADHPESSPRIPPGKGGYDDRDPTEVPHIPSQPETQDD
jgi:hypothetical protein